MSLSNPSCLRLRLRVRTAGHAEKANVEVREAAQRGTLCSSSHGRGGRREKEICRRKSLVWVIRLKSKESAKTRRLAPWFHTDLCRHDGW